MNHVRDITLRTFTLNTFHGTQLLLSTHLLDPLSVYTAGPVIDFNYLQPAFPLPFALSLSSEYEGAGISDPSLLLTPTDGDIL